MILRAKINIHSNTLATYTMESIYEVQKLSGTGLECVNSYRGAAKIHYIDNMTRNRELSPHKTSNSDLLKPQVSISPLRYPKVTT